MLHCKTFEKNTSFTFIYAVTVILAISDKLKIYCIHSLRETISIQHKTDCMAKKLRLSKLIYSNIKIIIRIAPQGKHLFVDYYALVRNVMIELKPRPLQDKTHTGDTR